MLRCKWTSERTASAPINGGLILAGVGGGIESQATSKWSSTTPASGGAIAMRYKGQETPPPSPKC